MRGYFLTFSNVIRASYVLAKNLAQLKLAASLKKKRPLLFNSSISISLIFSRSRSLSLSLCVVLREGGSLKKTQTFCVPTFPHRQKTLSELNHAHIYIYERNVLHRWRRACFNRFCVVFFFARARVVEFKQQQQQQQQFFVFARKKRIRLGEDVTGKNERIFSKKRRTTTTTLGRGGTVAADQRRRRRKYDGRRRRRRRREATTRRGDDRHRDHLHLPALQTSEIRFR